MSPEGFVRGSVKLVMEDGSNNGSSSNRAKGKLAYKGNTQKKGARTFDASLDRANNDAHCDMLSLQRIGSIQKLQFSIEKWIGADVTGTYSSQNPVDNGRFVLIRV